MGRIGPRDRIGTRLDALVWFAQQGKQVHPSRLATCTNTRETRLRLMVKGSRKVRGFAAKGVRQFDGVRDVNSPRIPERHLSSLSRVKEIRRVVF